MQGVAQIVRFNWPFYAGAAFAVAGAVVLAWKIQPPFSALLIFFAAVVFFITATTLIVSWYVYDYSPLYELRWADHPDLKAGALIVNIHAGFDETSEILVAKFPAATLRVFDFYDPALHTEASIRRARKSRVPFPQTISVSTRVLPLENSSVDAVFLIFAAHEIWDDDERIQFFQALKTTLTPNGEIIVAEHLRDVPNALAYSVGVLHFLPKAVWLKTFAGAGLQVADVARVTPFVTIFRLRNTA